MIKEAIVSSSDDVYLKHAGALSMECRRQGQWTKDMFFITPSENREELAKFERNGVKVLKRFLPDSHAYFYKFFVFDKIFKEYDRLLYLDCDCFLEGPLDLSKISGSSDGALFVDYEQWTVKETMLYLAGKQPLREEQQELLSCLSKSFDLNRKGFCSGCMLVTKGLIQDNTMEKLQFFRQRIRSVNYHCQGKEDGGDQPIFNLYFQHKAKQMPVGTMAWWHPNQKPCMISHTGGGKNAPWNHPALIHRYRENLAAWEGMVKMPARATRPKVYDCCIYFNEQDLFDFRAKLLNDVVDYFVVVEADTTFRGDKKGYNFHSDNPKVIHFKIEMPAFSGDPWVLENYQRNVIKQAVDGLSPAESDLILVSDLDEIPNPDRIEVGTYEQRLFYYDPTYEAERGWRGTFAMLYRDFKKTTPQGVRSLTMSSRSNLPIVKDGGWHFSYFGGLSRMSCKIRSFAHSEHDKPSVHQDLAKNVAQGKDIFERDIKFKHVGLETFPEKMRSSLEKFLLPANLKGIAGKGTVMGIENELSMPLKQYIQKLQSRILNKSTYFGVATRKMPMDMWIFQEIIFERKPDVIIEIGAFVGGSSLALAHIMELMDHGRVIAMDVNLSPYRALHSRITYLQGDGLALFPQVKASIKPEERIMVIEDSSHHAENTYRLLNVYGQLIKVGDYFIVEDTLARHGLDDGPCPGPWEGVERFLAENKSFESDRSREDFLLTWNPRGYLRRVSV